jgi:phosphinothricin acetyltransferase
MQSRIRVAGQADAAAIAAIYAPYVEDTRISFEEIAPGAAEIAMRMSNPLYPWLVAEQEERIVGFANSSAFRARRAYRWSVEVGIYVAPDAKRGGIGRALFERLLDLLTSQGFVTAIGAIALPNEASVGFHEALGFVHTGIYRQVGFKLGEWADVGLWQRDLAPREDSPAEPRPFAEVVPAYM